jgi:hypothetical protein
MISRLSPPGTATLGSPPCFHWLSGAAAVASAAPAAAGAAIVQIDLTGNVASTSAFVIDDQTGRDLTGDGIEDLTGTGDLSFFVNKGGPGIVGLVAGVKVGAFSTVSTSSLLESFVASVGLTKLSGAEPGTVRDFIPVTFSDARIHAGAPTEGFIEVLASNLGGGGHEVRLVRLVFDEARTSAPGKPSPGSVFPQWEDRSVWNLPPATDGRASRLRLTRQIASLGSAIDALRAKLHRETPFMTSAIRNRDAVRRISGLQRRLSALQRRLRHL